MNMTRAKQEERERRFARHERRAHERRKADKERCRVAIHEAAHAVVATLRGHHVTNVWVEPGRYGGLNGECHTRSLDEVTAVAGSIAECLRGIRVQPEYNQHDWASAIRCVTRNAIPDAERRAGRILAAEWPAVRAVADALLERMELSGPEVRQLVLENPGWRAA